jgi:hypothetical protein
MQNERNLTDRLGPWVTLALTMLYIFAMDLYFEYIISQEMDSIVQISATFLALFYTVWQIKLIVNQINKLIKKEIE